MCELKADVARLRAVVAAHTRWLERISRRQHTETKDLDEHDKRIACLEAASSWSA